MQVRSCLRGVLLAGGIGLLSGCSTLREPLYTDYWLTDPDAAGAATRFPERDPGPLVVAELAHKADLGICFSGGGTRSASATLGQLRGLREIGLLDRVRYISAVSGGAWAATPYVFLADGSDGRPAADERVFLGEYVPPHALTTNHLLQATRGSLAYVLSKTDVHLRNWANILALNGDESFSATLSAVLLDPFGLGDRNRFFTQSPASRDRILARHKHLSLDDFYVAHRDRPYLICGGTIRRYDLNPFKWAESKNKRIPVEYTPLYVGVRHRYDQVGRHTRTIGGGYVENFAYDTVEPRRAAGETGYQCRPRGGFAARFTLGDMLASSGAAPGELWLLRALLGLPVFEHWSPIPGANDGLAVSYKHEDGGNSENLGIMPLLARGVSNLIVFVNAPVPVLPGAVEARHRCPKDVALLFGSEPDGSPVGPKALDNQVFDRTRLHDLATELGRCASLGSPLVHCEAYDVLPNRLYGVAGGYRAKVCWVVLGPQLRGGSPGCQEPGPGRVRWLDELPAEVRGPICDCRWTFRHFPHLKTFLNKPSSLIDLTLPEAHAMAHFTSWAVVESGPRIKTFLALAAP